MDLIKLRCHFQQLGCDAWRADGEPEQLAELADEDVQRNAVQEANEDRLGKEVGQCTKPQETGTDAQQPGEDGHGHRQRQVERRSAGRQWRHRRGDQGTGGGIGTNDQLP